MIEVIRNRDAQFPVVTHINGDTRKFTQKAAIELRDKLNEVLDEKDLLKKEKLALLKRLEGLPTIEQFNIAIQKELKETEN